MLNVKKQLIQYKIQKFIAENNIVLFNQYTRVNVKEWQSLQKEFTKHGKINTFLVKSKIADRFVIFYQTYTNLKKNTCFNSNNKKHNLSCLKNFSINTNHQVGGDSNSDLKRRDLFLLKNFKTKDNFFFKKNLINTNIELFQGPTLLLGCNSQEELFKIFHLIVKTKILSSWEKKSLVPKNLLWLHGKKKRFRNDKILLGGIYESKALTHLDFNKLGHLDDTVYGILVALFSEKISLFMHSHINHYQQNLMQLWI